MSQPYCFCCRMIMWHYCRGRGEDAPVPVLAYQLYKTFSTFNKKHHYHILCYSLAWSQPSGLQFAPALYIKTAGCTCTYNIIGTVHPPVGLPRSSSRMLAFILTIEALDHWPMRGWRVLSSWREFFSSSWLVVPSSSSSFWLIMRPIQQ